MGDKPPVRTLASRQPQQGVHLIGLALRLQELERHQKRGRYVSHHQERPQTRPTDDTKSTTAADSPPFPRAPVRRPVAQWQRARCAPAQAAAPAALHLCRSPRPRQRAETRPATQCALSRPCVGGRCSCPWPRRRRALRSGAMLIFSPLRCEWCRAFVTGTPLVKDRPELF